MKKNEKIKIIKFKFSLFYKNLILNFLINFKL